MQANEQLEAELQLKKDEAVKDHQMLAHVKKKGKLIHHILKVMGFKFPSSFLRAIFQMNVSSNWWNSWMSWESLSKLKHQKEHHSAKSPTPRMLSLKSQHYVSNKFKTALKLLRFKKKLFISSFSHFFYVFIHSFFLCVFIYSMNFYFYLFYVFLFHVMNQIKLCQSS